MEWKGSLRRTCRKEGERWNRNHKVCTTSGLQSFYYHFKINYFHWNWICTWEIEIIRFLFVPFPPESQKKKSNNQDDSDEDDDDDDEAGPSTQQMAAVQPQPGYGAPMAQLGMPPVAGTPGMHPGGYQGKINSWIWHGFITAKRRESVHFIELISFWFVVLWIFFHTLQ